MPMLANAYGLGFAKDYLVAQYVEMKGTKEEKLVADVHSLSAGLKAYTTNYTAQALSVCREACGGHGYAAVNRLGGWRSDHDIFKTFEGDNTVLLQQTAGALAHLPCTRIVISRTGSVCCAAQWTCVPLAVGGSIRPLWHAAARSPVWHQSMPTVLLS